MKKEIKTIHFNSEQTVNKTLFVIANKLGVAMKRKPTDAVRTIIEEAGQIRINNPNAYDEFIKQFQNLKRLQSAEPT